MNTENSDTPKPKKKMKQKVEGAPSANSNLTKRKKRLKIHPKEGDTFYGLEELQEDAMIKELRKVYPSESIPIEEIVYNIAKILRERRVP